MTALLAMVRAVDPPAPSVPVTFPVKVSPALDEGAASIRDRVGLVAPGGIAEDQEMFDTVGGAAFGHDPTLHKLELVGSERVVTGGRAGRVESHS